jgi:trimethylamine:corrinoid methyltransferase-like protein
MWFPRFFDRARFDNWEKQGSKDLRQRLKEEAQKILAAHPAPKLPQAAVHEISQIVENHSPDV